MHTTQASPRRSWSRCGLALCLALAACGARGGSGSTINTEADAGSQPATLSFTCTQLCAPLAGAASCGASGVSTCMSSCNASLASTPAACAASANALYACTQTATPMCSTSSSFPFPSCGSQYSAYVACVTSPQADAGVAPPTDTGGTPRVDSGTSTDECADATNCGACTGRSRCGWCAGRCWVGSSSGPTGGSCGGTPWAWTSGQCGGTPPPVDGGGTISVACQSCAFSMCSEPANACSSDPACIQCVASPNGACLSNPRFAAVAECACGRCTETCGSLCAMFQ